MAIKFATRWRRDDTNVKFARKEVAFKHNRTTQEGETAYQPLYKRKVTRQVPHSEIAFGCWLFVSVVTPRIRRRNGFQHVSEGVTCTYLPSSKRSRTLCLTGLEPFELPEVAAVCVPISHPLYPQISYKLNNVSSPLCCIHTISKVILFASRPSIAI